MVSNSAHGHISHPSDRKDDFLFRLSLKLLIMNKRGEVLVVKESGRTWWDLPGGGMDHDEDIKTAIAREGKEEVNLEGDFTYRVISVDSPVYLENANVWQVRLIFHVIPDNMIFSTGVDADEITFMQPEALKDSALETERRIHNYAQLAKRN